MHHLDTDTVISLLRGNADIAEQLKAIVPNAGISTLVLAELHFGIHASRNPDESRRRLDRFLPSLQVVSFNEIAAETYGRIRHSLKIRGLPIGDIDTFIAAVAVAHDATLVTHNRKHFAHIEGLAIEDWIA